MDAPPSTCLAAPDTGALVRLLAEHTRDVIFRCRVRPHHSLEYISPACTAISGYTPDEFYANPGLSETLVHPDDRPIRAAQARPGRQAARFRLRWQHRDGRVIWTEQHWQFIYDADGDLAAIEGCIRDITEYVTAEARLRLLGTALESASNAVVIASPDGMIEWVNPAFTGLTGYSAAEAFGRRTNLLKSGRHDLSFYQHLWDVVLSGRAWSGELINRRKDGTLYHEEQTITPVLNGGVITHFVAIKQDVSARVEREREREALLVMAAALRTAHTRAEMLPALLGQTLVLLQATSCALAMRDPLTGEALFELGVGGWASASGRRLPGAAGITGLVIATGRAFRNAGGEEDLEITGQSLPPRHRAVACVPLRSHDTVIGALWIACPDPIEDGDLRLLSGIADMAANAIQRTTLFEQTEQRLQRLTGLHVIDQAITASLDQRIGLSVVIDQATRQLGTHAADILLLNEAEQTLDYAVGRGFHTAYGLGARAQMGNGMAARVVRERRRICVGNLSEHKGFFFRHELMAAEGFQAYVATPLIAQGRILGVLEVFHRTPFAPDSEWLDYLDALAGRAAVAIDHVELFGRLQRSHADLETAYDTTLEGWSRALDLRDKETEGHSQRVTEMTVRLARAMGLDEREIVHIRRGALLHDIGKMGIPDAILLKPGPLTEQEWEVMRRHPVYGYELLAPISYLRPALDIPWCHHEHWDGSGYPRGLAGEQIPLAARLFAVVDVWDALRSDRPYRRAWAPATVRDHILAQAGQHFDPLVVEAFLALERE